VSQAAESRITGLGARLGDCLESIVDVCLLSFQTKKNKDCIKLPQLVPVPTLHHVSALLVILSPLHLMELPIHQLSPTHRHCDLSLLLPPSSFLPAVFPPVEPSSSTRRNRNATNSTCISKLTERRRRPRTPSGTTRDEHAQRTQQGHPLAHGEPSTPPRDASCASAVYTKNTHIHVLEVDFWKGKCGACSS
jgi:hypothetical protein